LGGLDAVAAIGFGASSIVSQVSDRKLSELDFLIALCIGIISKTWVGENHVIDPQTIQIFLCTSWASKKSNQENVLSPSHSAAPVASNRQRAALCGKTGLHVLFDHTFTATPHWGQGCTAMPRLFPRSTGQECSKNLAHATPLYHLGDGAQPLHRSSHLWLRHTPACYPPQ